ncbi:uncharacterized protein OCT59_001829 [Rhizophagus irregularis]|uniref:F-box domain-containing protein n=2 Tax=Rhizophagus irregularis TaxID=588596 RepID=A0A915ZGM9_9GLOM|nr:hypothetical protein GLOIN_2v1788523 [Rhizophagus irregularis DAOM 181602=DAOM 197198]UZO10232.1 hypothetical protein OCT59_001829 [Rhizophagus irregularis]POG59932.1 hypothetical protein GLOIN_2v1788523 [Rhizophagus irregularis DAOM 181602=DAOM 197198]CAB4481776.1 unnamed protein product [Rhizophagus irregularis]CAB5168691.1 unnamed protein product [Rhizophagus irregularis]CAB5375471.1 unnamed protein product [Rhizophagus irregularis]|eukprot:XP_025166798.1 hypothetical protein GLOIN_2v1788523 [Rhizophagus irregularis DAOM 181602=DAOM 197198]
MNTTNSVENQQMILRLPPEILGKILLLTSLQTRTMILSSVCKNFNHFIFNHDILWSKLNLNSLKNITNFTIPKIFYHNIPNDTKNYIRELFINDININKESLKVILKNCINLKSLHLRTYKDLDMEIVKNLLEELYGEKGEQQTNEQVNDQVNESANEQTNEQANEQTNEQANEQVNERNQEVQVQEEKSVEGRLSTVVKKSICHLTTIYWYLDHDFWIWWAPPQKTSLESTLQKLSNDLKATVKVPWCDFCNQKQASFLITCSGDLHEQKWSVFGCFECTDNGNIQANFKCDECLKAEKLKDQLAISALESLAQTDDNSNGSFNIVEEIINVINEGDNEAENDVIIVDDDIEDVVVINNNSNNNNNE